MAPAICGLVGHEVLAMRSPPTISAHSDSKQLNPGNQTSKTCAWAMRDHSWASASDDPVLLAGTRRHFLDLLVAKALWPGLAARLRWPSHHVLTAWGSDLQLPASTATPARQCLSGSPWLSGHRPASPSRCRAPPRSGACGAAPACSRQKLVVNYDTRRSQVVERVVDIFPRLPGKSEPETRVSGNQKKKEEEDEEEEVEEEASEEK